MVGPGVLESRGRRLVRPVISSFRPTPPGYTPRRSEHQRMAAQENSETTEIPLYVGLEA